jgi:DNA-binding winged helix-turn-helix (wHTH) protein
MSTPNPYDSIIRFSSFELDFSGRVLRKSGMRLRCQEQPLQVLAALLEKPGALITREELRQRVWSQETFVDFDHALNTAVKKLRHVLSDDADAPRYIETVPRRGYRFVGAIQPGPQITVVEQALRTGPSPVVATDSSPPHYLRAFVAGVLGVLLALIAGYYFDARRARASRTPPA